MVRTQRLPPRLAPPRLLLAIAAASFAVAPAHARDKLEATYSATLAGMPIGTGAMTLDISRDSYAATGTGKAGGLLRLFSSGSGDVSVQGAIQGTKLSPTRYAHNVHSRNKLQAVKMALMASSVKQLAVEPPLKQEGGDLVPLTEANKRGVLDPLSAGIVPAAGTNGLGAEACKHKMPVFDGRLRFDLTLSYKRHENVAVTGYQGSVLVCRVDFKPIGGHEKEKFAIKYLRENRDMEIWFAPLAGTPFLAVFRIFVPTPLGPAVLQATHFAAAPVATRTGAAQAR